MITIQLDEEATLTFDHCECPHCFSDENVYTLTLIGDVDYVIERIEDDLLYCKNVDCKHVFDWVTDDIIIHSDEIFVQD